MTPFTDTPVQIGLAAGPPTGGAPDCFVSHLRTDQPIQWTAQRALGLTPAIRLAVPEKSWHDALFAAAASPILLQHLIDALRLHSHPVAALTHPDTSTWHRLRKS